MSSGPGWLQNFRDQNRVDIRRGTLRVLVNDLTLQRHVQHIWIRDVMHLPICEHESERDERAGMEQRLQMLRVHA